MYNIVSISQAGSTSNITTHSASICPLLFPRRASQTACRVNPAHKGQGGEAGQSLRYQGGGGRKSWSNPDIYVFRSQWIQSSKWARCRSTITRQFAVSSTRNRSPLCTVASWAGLDPRRIVTIAPVPLFPLEWGKKEKEWSYDNSNFTIDGGRLRLDCGCLCVSWERGWRDL